MNWYEYKFIFTVQLMADPEMITVQEYIEIVKEKGLIVEPGLPNPWVTCDFQLKIETNME